MNKTRESRIKNIVLWLPFFSKALITKAPGQIAEHLARRDYTVRIMTYRSDLNKELKAINRVELISLNGGPELCQLIGFPLQYYILKNRKNIDCLILYFASLNNALTSILFRLFNKRGTYIIKMDTNGKFYTNTGYKLIKDSKGTVEAVAFRRNLANKVLNRFVRELTLRILSFTADLLTIETPEARQRVLSYHPWLKHKLVVLPNGINKDVWDKLSRSIELARERKILFVGRIEYGKGVDLLIRSFWRLKDKYPDWNLELVGELSPSFEGEIEKLAPGDSKGRIVLAGPLYGKELAERYLGSEIFCFASRSESFGNVLVEATYFGNAVISSDVGAARYILDYGNAGMIFENGNLDELIKCLDTLMGDEPLRKRLAAAGKSRCEGLFTWETIIDELDHHISYFSARRRSVVHSIGIGGANVKQ